MAILGSSGGTNDIYTNSTATIGLRSAGVGVPFKIDSESKLHPADPDVLDNVERVVADINNATEAISGYVQNIGQLGGDCILPDGRSLFGLGTGTGASRIVVLKADGYTRDGDGAYNFTAGNQASQKQLMIWQLGEVQDYYLVGVALRGLQSTPSHIYQDIKLVRVPKDGGTFPAATNVPTTSYVQNTAYNGAVGNTYMTKLTDVDNWQTSRGNTISLFATPPGTGTSNTSYQFTANVISSTGLMLTTAANTSAVTLENTTAGYPIDIIKIDDATGIFLVLHETSANVKTLTKLVVSSTAQITTSTVAVINSGYTNMNSNIDRHWVSMVGAGTGSNNLYFFDSSTTTGNATAIDGQPCTYNSSNDSLTWGTYSAIALPDGYQFSGSDRRTTKWNWTYSSADKRIYFGLLVGEGIALNTVDNALNIANLHTYMPFHNSYQTNMVASRDGTLISQYSVWAQFLANTYAYVMDTSRGITSNVAAIPLASGVLGDTVNVSLVGGITSAATLPSSHYLEKERLFYPYTVYVNGVEQRNSTSSVIKSIQRGEIAFSAIQFEHTISINKVLMNKSTVSLYGSVEYISTAQNQPWLAYAASPHIEVLSASSFKIITGTQFSTNSLGTGTISWEVVEYV